MDMPILRMTMGNSHLKNRLPYGNSRRACILGFLFLALIGSSWTSLAADPDDRWTTESIVDRARAKAKRHLKPGIGAAEVEAFFRSEGYNFEYLGPDKIVLKQDEDHRRTGVDFVGRYYSSSPDLVVTDKKIWNYNRESRNFLLYGACEPVTAC